MAALEVEEKLQEACGLFGCVASGQWPTTLDIPHTIYLGLIGIQHRGQEGAGIVTSKGENSGFLIHKGTGLVSNVFKEENLVKLTGNLGIGHTRYSTLGGSDYSNIQPFVVHTIHGLLAVAHNGQLVNASVLRKKILEAGVGLSTGSDSELITQILSMPPPAGESEGPDWPARIRHMMSLTQAAYSLLVQHNDVIYAIRDPYGNRPLCLGVLLPPCEKKEENVNNSYDGFVVSSESCCFPSISAKFLREVQPGEIVKITKNGCYSVCVVERPNSTLPAFCLFEYVYFARPDSMLEGQMVYTVRKECGIQLAKEAPLDVDLISTVPESATPAATGFSIQSGIPYVEVLCKNPYVGRSFIQPTTRLRQLAVLKKFGPISSNFKGKKIALVDDSIVRGNTIGAIIRILKEAGAKEVHIRIASPPIHFPCYMGININSKEELIANQLNAQQLAESLGAASLVYLSVNGLVTAIQKGIKNNCKPVGHCTACLTGKYPVELEW